MDDTLPAATLPNAAAVAVGDGRGLELEPGLLAESPLKAVLNEVCRAAEAGNLSLVQHKCNQVLEICGIPDAKGGRPVSSHSSSARAPGGWGYRPDFMLYSVLLADRLTLSWQLGTLALDLGPWTDLGFQFSILKSEV